jgi:heat shock protein HslJ
MRFACIAVCCLLLAVLSACAAGRGAGANAGGVGLEDVADRVYYLVSMDGKNFEGENAPELSLTWEGRVIGRACNRFNGPARIENGMLTAKNVVSTRMACFQPFLTELEQTLFDMLRHGTQMSLDGRRLTLARDGHTLVYELPPPRP